MEQVINTRKAKVKDMTVNVKGLGKITASKEVLNWISLLADEASENYNKRDRSALGKMAFEISNDIYNQLNETGYYK